MVVVRRMTVDPDVHGVLPDGQLAQPRAVPAAELKRELVILRRQRRIEDHLGPLAAVDPELFPHLSRLVLAHRAREVAAAEDRIGGRDLGARGADVLGSALELAGEEDAVAITALPLDFAQPFARHPALLGNPAPGSRALALEEEGSDAEDQHRGRRPEKDADPWAGALPAHLPRGRWAQGAPPRGSGRVRQHARLLLVRVRPLALPSAQGARQRVERREQLVAALVALRRLLRAP